MRTAFIFALSGVTALLFGCGMESGDSRDIGTGGGRGTGTGDGPGGVGTGAPGTDGDWGGGGGASSRPGTGSGEPGVLTAGVWDDNLNFDWFLEYRDGVLAEPWAVPELTLEEHEEAYSRFGAVRAPNATLDVALVIDTTGSMSDEISYLQAELRDIAGRISTAYPMSSQRWALILYRDEGDEYVVRTFAFTEDMARFQADLAAQSASGGGDYPEAPHEALSIMNQLDWRSDAATARLAFWVADAPHHAQFTETMGRQIRHASEADVHIYPVASSGVDEMTEATMRSAAQITGGRYVFLTDDSGVGGAHLEPKLPCYFVTRLNAALLRVIDIEMTGVYREPAPEEIIRTGGDPTDGRCTLESGQVLQVF
jgi:hypothetical protein